ncbi:hypothetical protein BH23VER1_BH23VER1_01190 [soil metagenome]
MIDGQSNSILSLMGIAVCRSLTLFDEFGQPAFQRLGHPRCYFNRGRDSPPFNS